MDERVPGPGWRAGLRGRADECALLDGFIGDIRRGHSRSLVVRGEAGIGKTALLEYLVASAEDLTVVRADGVESEMELAYAGLHQLCASHLDRLPRLPAHEPGDPRPSVPHPRTVEWHLHKVFVKLEIHSRDELADACDDQFRRGTRGAARAGSASLCPSQQEASEDQCARVHDPRQALV